MKDKDKAEKLIQKFNSGKATSEEKELVESWYLKFNAGETLDPKELQQEHDLGLEKLNQYINRGQTIRLKIAAAAAVLLMAMAGLFVYQYQNRSVKDRISLAEDIPAGKNKAILMLANGRAIPLNDSKNALLVAADRFSYDDGTVLKDSLLNVLNSTAVFKAQTPRGGTYKITLSDGTMVTLNAESSLSFPKVFSGGKRIVELTGEGYFEVAKNKAMPFVVNSRGQSITVLGTQFNLNTYPAGPIVAKTTLVEGSVQIKTEGAELRLVPGQQASLIHEQLQLSSADVEAVISWKEGYFRFNEEKIGEIMSKISRWYDVDVVYQGKVTKERFTGTISRFSNISDVLDMLERTKIVHFEIEGRRITVLN